MTFEEIKSAINAKFSDSVLENPEGEENVIYLDSRSWNKIALFLISDKDLFFNQLECLTGMDLGSETSLEVRYNFHSMEHRHKVEIRLTVDRKDPKIPSVEQIWRMADWFEREAYDMYGIVFEGHRDMTRILCPDDWEGWPLRKDYEVQDTYHGIVVPKIKEGWE
ncbi:MAG: NADH-quinone oxidoreductase subunit C [Candidatus Marinimicrobia bacterium]|nr:NADH-quinone oxidoreductase subunit C [Candidatus Neomarinimicrobiota bacterium]|tara:strand:+ start:813 stop:1307 length:495 start_codon:yes stop_codon:yes gene_type:complete